MARSKSLIQFTGSLGEINGYIPKDSAPGDGFIIRTNGGPTAKQIKTLPSCAVVRRNNDEFASSSCAAKFVRRAIYPVGHLADYNIQPALTRICKLIQREDEKSAHGDRKVLFSQFGNYLSGFNLNKHHPFDGVVRHPLMATLDHDTRSATISVPDLQPGIGLVLPWQQPFYRVIFSLSTVPDMWRVSRNNDHPEVASFCTPWTIAKQGLPAQQIQLQLKGPLPGTACMIVAAGIEIGMILTDALIDTVRNNGCAKVLIAG